MILSKWSQAVDFEVEISPTYWLRLSPAKTV